MESTGLELTMIYIIGIMAVIGNMRIFTWCDRAVGCLSICCNFQKDLNIYNTVS